MKILEIKSWNSPLLTTTNSSLWIANLILLRNYLIKVHLFLALRSGRAYLTKLHSRKQKELKIL